MAKETETRMNIVAINRVDPYVKNIVDSSAHVAFYTFNAETSGKDAFQHFLVTSNTPFYSLQNGKRPISRVLCLSTAETQSHFTAFSLTIV